jgi:hypothetical protein
VAIEVEGSFRRRWGKDKADEVPVPAGASAGSPAGGSVPSASTPGRGETSPALLPSFEFGEADNAR